MHWSEEETRPPFDQKQTSTPASSWRGWSLWLRVLGVVVAFVGGFAFSFPNPLPLALIIVEPIVLAIVSAGLLRSWWAMLIVPVAFSVGFFLGNIFQMGGFDLKSWVVSGFEGVDILVSQSAMFS